MYERAHMFACSHRFNALFAPSRSKTCLITLIIVLIFPYYWSSTKLVWYYGPVLSFLFSLVQTALPKSQEFSTRHNELARCYFSLLLACNWQMKFKFLFETFHKYDMSWSVLSRAKANESKFTSGDSWWQQTVMMLFSYFFLSRTIHWPIYLNILWCVCVFHSI